MQQDFHPEMIRQMPIPIIDLDDAISIDKLVRDAFGKFDLAVDLENEARFVVERAIEESRL